MDMNSRHDLCILEGQIRECYARVVYSHKTHEKCRDILLSRLSKIKIWQIVLSAVTTGGFIASIVVDGNIASIIGAFVSTVLLMLNSYVKNYDLGEIAQKHKDAADDLWYIREKYLNLLCDLKLRDVDIITLQKQRDGLLEDLYSVYSGSPSSTYKAYLLAQKGLKETEEMSFSDAEIDAFLPKELAKTVAIK